MNPPQPPAPAPAADLPGADLRRRIERELVDNILPFWVARTPDQENGGFYGALTNDLQVLNDTPRSSVLCARILWTFSAAYRAYGGEHLLAMARRAYDYLVQAHWDPTYGGVYWRIDRHGQPVDANKLCYGQAFAIYGLAEYYRATGDPASLACAQELFELLERHAHDPQHGGYREGGARDWSAHTVRLSNLEPDTSKSMNTLLHIMEAFVNLARCWDEPRVRARVRELVDAFLGHIIDPDTSHFRLFFDDAWSAHGHVVSYGHDIEGSWLLVEAAELLGDPELLARVRAVAVRMAEAVYAGGLETDGSLLNEGGTDEPRAFEKHWWVHAEAMVGFYNAYQISGQARFAQAAAGVWQYIEQKFVDRRHGEWFKVLSRAGQPYDVPPKVGPWECPYHHSRACLELLARLPAEAA